MLLISAEILEERKEVFYYLYKRNVSGLLTVEILNLWIVCYENQVKRRFFQHELKCIFVGRQRKQGCNGLPRILGCCFTIVTQFF